MLSQRTPHAGEDWGLRSCSKKAAAHPREKFSLFFHTHFWMYIHFPAHKYYSYGFIPNHFKLVIQVLIRYLHLFHLVGHTLLFKVHTSIPMVLCVQTMLPFKQPLTLSGEQIRFWQSVTKETKFLLFFQAQVYCTGNLILVCSCVIP